MAGRVYSPVHSQMWVDPRITKMHQDSVLLLTYLMTNHHLNGAGYYYFNPKYAAVDLPLDQEAVDRGFDELENQGYLLRNPTTHALLLLDWSMHNPLSSSKNAKHVETLFEQRRVPQGEPKMELQFFCNLFNAALRHLDNENFDDFFEFLKVNMERLEPGLINQLYQEHLDPSQKELPPSTDDDLSQEGVE